MDAALRSRSVVRALISAFIVGMLGLQATVIVAAIEEWYYPFVTYGMYSGVRHDGDFIEVYYPIYATLATGEEVRVQSRDVGLNFFKLNRHGQRISNGDDAAAHYLMAELESRQGVTVTQLRLTTYPAIITRNGVEDAPPETLRIVNREQ